MQKDSWIKTVVVWGLIMLMIGLTFKLINRPAESSTISFSAFLAALDRDIEDPKRIFEVIVRGDAVRGDEIQAKLKDQTTIGTYAPYDELLRKELREKLVAKQIPVNYEKQEEGQYWWASFLTMWLPLLLLVGFMVLLMRNMQGAGGKALTFGKSKAKMMPESSQKVTFKDVAGVDEAKQECSEIISFLKDHKRFQEIGARIPKGVLMMGPPGTGKTLLARAIAGEAGVPFFHISGSDFVEMFVGVGASRVRDLFENAKKNSPCIIFIDEIDAVGRHRGAGVGGGHDEREQTLNQLLVEMDGFEANEAVIVIAATNRPDVLDPALLRPGRFDRRVIVSLPDARGRKEILNVYLNRVKKTNDIDVEKLALGTPGFSGADLENLINEAALWAARHAGKRIGMGDLEAAKDKILMGPERKSMIMSKDVLTVTAYHETGHALVSYFRKSKNMVHKLTIIPRGRALGVTAFLPKEDIYNHSMEDLYNQIAVAMGGRAAEEVKFGQFTTGASNDIKQASDIARAMVCQYGMSKLGPVNFAEKHENPFLGKELGDQHHHSEAISREIDNEVSSIIKHHYEIAKQILLDHMDVFERVSAVLLEVETLDQEEFLAVIAGASLAEIQAMQTKKADAGKVDDSGSSSSAASPSATKAEAPLTPSSLPTPLPA